jgi:acyl-CoA thioester hydrolase
VEGYRFKHRLIVRYAEVDTQKIVFNSNYLNYINITASEYFREVLQLDLFELEESEIVDRVMKKATLEYNKPAKMYDILNIWCRTVKMGATSMTMEFIITREGEDDILFSAEIIYVTYNPKKEVIKPIPEILRQSIERYEHGPAAM